MEKRPLSLTIIGWFLLLSAAFGLISQFTMQDNPVTQQIMRDSAFPAGVHLAFGIAGALVTAACGYGVLKGFNWSRWLYLGWSAIAVIFTFVALHLTSFLIITVLFIAVIAFFLFREPANLWFNNGGSGAGDHAPSE